MPCLGTDTSQTSGNHLKQDNTSKCFRQMCRSEHSPDTPLAQRIPQGVPRSSKMKELFQHPSLGIQVPSQKVLGPSKPTPNTFGEGTWILRACEVLQTHKPDPLPGSAYRPPGLDPFARTAHLLGGQGYGYPRHDLGLGLAKDSGSVQVIEQVVDFRSCVARELARSDASRCRVLCLGNPCPGYTAMASIVRNLKGSGHVLVFVPERVAWSTGFVHCLEEKMLLSEMGCHDRNWGRMG